MSNEEYARLRVQVQRLAGERVPCVEETHPVHGHRFRTWAFVGRGQRLEAVAPTTVEATADLIAQLKAYQKRRRRKG